MYMSTMADLPHDDYPRTVLELEERFSSEAACREYLQQLRWPDGFRCPRCLGERGWPVGRGDLMECSSCHRQTSVIAGTIFEGTRKPLSMWATLLPAHAASGGCASSAVQESCWRGNLNEVDTPLPVLCRGLTRGSSRMGLYEWLT